MNSMESTRHPMACVATSTGCSNTATAPLQPERRRALLEPVDRSTAASAPCASTPHWSTQQLVALARTFLDQCKQLEQAVSRVDQLAVIKRVMRFHFDADWSEQEILALQGLMLYYRRQLLDARLSVGDRVEILKRIYTDQPPEWMEAEIVQLHFLLLDECRGLANPKYSLADKLDILRWMLSEPAQSDAAFSFHRCARMAWGFCEVASVRQDLMELARGWLAESIRGYPPHVRVWVRQCLAQDPSRLAERLDKNPQLINELVQNLQRQPDLFAA